MNRTELKQTIINKFDIKIGWGKICYTINRTARQVLDNETFNAIADKQDDEYYASVERDGTLYNGKFFYQKDYNRKEVEIISAFLDYFTDEQLGFILSGVTSVL